MNAFYHLALVTVPCVALGAVIGRVARWLKDRTAEDRARRRSR